MIEVEKEGIILTRTDLEFENEGVLNPAAIREGDSVHLFYRAMRNCPLLFKVSLNILRFHQILRPNESFHTSLLFLPINLNMRY